MNKTKRRRQQGKTEIPRLFGPIFNIFFNFFNFSYN